MYRKLLFPCLLVGLCLTSFGSITAQAQENADCFDCHDDDTLTTERDGQDVSRYVNPQVLAESVHREIKCIKCHVDLAGSDAGHAERLAPADCSGCHEDQLKLFTESLHGQALARGDKLAPRCQNCHGSHAILPIKDLKSSVSPLRIPFVCGSCHSEGATVQQQRTIHEDHIIENYSESLHGEGLFKKGLIVTATCVSCHSAHSILPHTDPRSTIARDNVSTTCQTCHYQIESVHRKVIRGELWQTNPESVPVCVDCHQPHKARKIQYDDSVADSDCMLCHGKEGLTAGADGRSLFVYNKELQNSMHLKVPCAQCHSGVDPSKQRACETITNKVDCSVCHKGQGDEYNTSTHGKLTQEHNPNAPTCTLCHGTHAVLGKKDVNSVTFPINVPRLCASCHADTGKAAAIYQGPQHHIDINYNESIHGKGLLESGLVVTATCTSCHTAHRALPASDPASTVNRANIAATCWQCHRGVYEKYVRSIHYSATDNTGKFPVCFDCHSPHTIKRTDQSQFQFEILNVCGKCHRAIADTYFSTYHGKGSELGFAGTAKCHDCHGSHDITPVTDPKSHLSRANIVDTCRKCHSGASRQFAGYLTHATHTDPHKYPLIFWTFWLMTSLLVGTSAFFGLHTLLWIPRSLQMRRAHPLQPEQLEAKQYLRFPLLYRVLHALMIISFLTLAMTGMTLKFSYTRWAGVLSYLLGGFEVSGMLHRVAAVTLLSIFSVHIWDLLRNKKEQMGGWKQLMLGPDTVLFTRRDLWEFIATIKWYVGKGERPQYGRWTYWEKFDYFAVFWGVAVIGSSGLMLWFPVFFTRFLPGVLINVATIIHSDEALLAAGFIFTIHFFNTHFRPEKFPMDTVIFTGRMPLEELKRERPREYEELVAANTLEEYLVDPLPPRTVKAMRIFGWIALTIGLSLTAAIIYAMLIYALLFA